MLPDKLSEKLPDSDWEGLNDDQVGLLKRGFLSGLVMAVALGVVGGVLWLSWTLAGPIDTIAYAFLFLFGLTFLPTIILFAAPSFTSSLKKAFGKLHFILGQTAFGSGYLVQREEEWEMCPGTRDRVYIDDRWHNIEGGQTNASVLGWQRFGILRYKDDKTLQRSRVDVDEIAQTQTDGGAVNRGGFREIVPNPRDVDPSNWLVDLKRVMTRGIRKFGDGAVIERVEEVTMRDEAKSGRVGGWEAVIGGLAGLIFGVATGYVMLGGV